MNAKIYSKDNLDSQFRYNRSYPPAIKGVTPTHPWTHQMSIDTHSRDRDSRDTSCTGGQRTYCRGHLLILVVKYRFESTSKVSVWKYQ